MFWDPDSTLRFHVMEKSTGIFLPNKYEADPMGFYHVFNAYEEDNCLVLDAPFKPSPTSYDVFTVVLQKVPSETNPKVRNHGEGPY